MDCIGIDLGFMGPEAYAILRVLSKKKNSKFECILGTELNIYLE